jgi:hypothetical protein
VRLNRLSVDLNHPLRFSSVSGRSRVFFPAARTTACRDMSLGT